MSERMVASSALATVIRRLNVRRVASMEFLAEAEGGGGRPRLFGGMVAGQATVAAARCNEGFLIHSLHAYFLAPGDPSLPVRYEVTALKRGRNFQACQVLGNQGDRTIFSLQASFQRTGPGFAHSDVPPDAPPPDDLPDLTRKYWGGIGPVQLRDCDAGDLAQAAKQGMRRLWMRPTGTPPDDPVLQLGLVVFASDMTLMRTGVLQHPGHHLKRRGASLDHSLWFHQAPRFDDWLLYKMTSPSAQSGRPLILGAMYGRDGVRVLSSAQEGFFREPES